LKDVEKTLVELPVVGEKNYYSQTTKLFHLRDKVPLNKSMNEFSKRGKRNRAFNEHFLNKALIPINRSIKENVGIVKNYRRAVILVSDEKKLNEALHRYNINKSIRFKIPNIHLENTGSLIIKTREDTN